VLIIIIFRLVFTETYFKYTDAFKIRKELRLYIQKKVKFGIIYMNYPFVSFITISMLWQNPLDLEFYPIRIIILILSLFHVTFGLNKLYLESSHFDEFLKHRDKIPNQYTRCHMPTSVGAVKGSVKLLTICAGCVTAGYGLISAAHDMEGILNPGVRTMSQNTVSLLIKGYTSESPEIYRVGDFLLRKCPNVGDSKVLLFINDPNASWVFDDVRIGYIAKKIGYMPGQTMMTVSQYDSYLRCLEDIKQNSDSFKMWKEQRALFHLAVTPDSTSIGLKVPH
jgi:hypothetical protein